MLDYQHQSAWPNQFGHQQSPINLLSNDAIEHGPMPNWQIKQPYRTKLEINDQTTVRLTAQSGECSFWGRDFEFQQVHFHAPAEHLVDGQSAPFEVHLVHQNAIGQLLVIAILVQLGNGDTTFDQLLKHFDQHHDVPLTLDLSDWTNWKDSHGYHYLGSLTTPPLTEGVEWFVITNTKLTISVDQLRRYRDWFDPNDRNVQSLNGRTIDRI